MTLRTRSESQDAYGDTTATYATYALAYGKLEAASARERFESQQVQSDITHKIEFRYETSYDGLGPDDQIVFDGRTFDVLTVFDPDGLKKRLVATVIERL